MKRNGRKIFGSVVPYEHVWNMGPNFSPTFVTSANLSVGGKEVPVGEYNFVAIPYSDKWAMIIKKRYGKDKPNGMDEVARIDLLVRRLRPPRDSFAISFDQYQGGCVLNLRWDETEASVLVAEQK